MKKAYIAACQKAYNVVSRNANSMLMILGVVLLSGGIVQTSEAVSYFQNADYNDLLVRSAVGNLFGLIEGAFGALIMVTAGLGAIVAAAMGAYRLAVSLLVVAVGAFILRALVSLFFGEGFEHSNAT